MGAQDGVAGSSLVCMRRNLVGVAWALAAGLLLAPIGSRGSCPSGGECVTVAISVLGIATHWIIAVAAVLIVGMLVWVLYPRANSRW